MSSACTVCHRSSWADVCPACERAQARAEAVCDMSNYKGCWCTRVAGHDGQHVCDPEHGCGQPFGGAA